jgi:hypothetical protein
VGAPSYLAAARDPDKSFALYGLDHNGTATFRVPLPARGHAGAGHPHRAEAVAFARRPGTFALVIDCASGAVLHRLSPPDGQHFNGHGVFAENGALLITSERVGKTREGRIDLWDVEAGYTRIGEVPTAGPDLHDLRLMPDGRTLVVANGGIATDAADRRKLNIPAMRPNLTYLTLDGEIRDPAELDPALWKNSIRHLAVRADGLVGFATQWQGETGTAPSLLGLHRRGTTPVLASAPLADELAMQDYAGSIAFSGPGDELAITSPRGGRLHRFSDSSAFLNPVSRPDVCGLAPLTDGSPASDGLGGLIAIGTEGTIALNRLPCAWDNHFVPLWHGPVVTTKPAVTTHIDDMS